MISLKVSLVSSILSNLFGRKNQSNIGKRFKGKLLLSFSFINQTKTSKSTSLEIKFKMFTAKEIFFQIIDLL